MLTYIVPSFQAQITPSQDAYTDTAHPTINYGTAITLGVENATNSIQTTYIQFDLSSIPAGYTGSNIAKATLKVYVNTVAAGGSFNVDFVNGSWQENKITANLAPALGTTIVASVPLTSANKNDYISVDITAALQAWLNGTQANDGIALVANNPLSSTLDSKENTKTSHSAELDVVFASSGSGGITGINTAAGSGLIGGGTSGTLNLSLTNTCASSQILQWNGSAWTCSSVGTGTVTGVIAGADMTGGGSSGNVTLNVDTTKVPQLAVANTFTGNQAVNGNVSATGIVTGNSFAIGSNLFAYGSYASQNVFVGFSGNSAMSGQGNTSSGYQALLHNTTGQTNTAIGDLALFSSQTGNNNVATGSSALYSNTTGTDNTALGTNALVSNSTGGSNTATGSGALYYNTTGNFNTATGYLAGAANTTGSDNSAFGYKALLSNQTGGGNAAIGLDALASNTTGSYNTATGMSSSLFNTTASYNTAIGFSALSGTTAGVTGNNNTGIGARALANNTTGSGDSAFGYGSGFAVDNSLITGAYDTFLGYNTVLGTGALSNATAIGSSAEVDSSNALVLGSINGVNGATASTNVGIGTTSPFHVLEVNAGAAITAQMALVSSGTDAAISVKNTSSGGREYWIDSGSGAAGVGPGNFAIWDATAGAARFVVNGYGSVGIGTIYPTNLLTLVQGGGSALADGWNTYSSRRWKNNIHTLENALAKVEKLRGVSYDLKISGKHEVGVIAEEVGAVVPEVVSWDKDGKNALGVDYGRLTALLIEATKEQQALIRVQRQEISRQQRQLAAQEKRLATLNSQVTAIRTSLRFDRTANLEGAKVKDRETTAPPSRESLNGQANSINTTR